MKIRFWGVRGSIATPLANAALLSKIEMALQLGLKAGLTDEMQVPDFIRNLPWHVRQTAGGDTACIQVEAGDKLIILDAGTGIRPLGIDLIRKSMGEPIEAHIFITHTHWDHINGIPFFSPAYNPKNKLIIYSAFPDIEKRIRGQQDPEYFPVPLASTFKFVNLDPKKTFSIGDVDINVKMLNHPGDSYGYRVTHNGKSMVYATDSEYKDLSVEAVKPFTRFFEGAEMLIFDAQYTMLENVEKEDWGHSNVFSGIDMALEAGVKRIVFTHHDPTYDDRKLWEIQQKAYEYLELFRSGKPLELVLAYEGLILSV